MPDPLPAPPHSGWEPWPPGEDGALRVNGDVRVRHGLGAPGVPPRDAWIWVPPSYGSGERRYPVLYLQDGQNLFDDATSFSGKWGVDDAMSDLAARGIEALVVGVANGGDARLDEYSPWRDRKHGGGRGDAYLDFLEGVVKPRVDRDFRTLPGPGSTGIGGSSMGGLLALHAFLTRPHVWGLATVQSPSLWFARKAALREAEARAAGRGRLHLDVGTAEGWRTVRDARRLRRILARRAYAEGLNLLYVEERGGTHHERAWGRRFGPAAAFVLGAWPSR